MEKSNPKNPTLQTVWQRTWKSLEQSLLLSERTSAATGELWEKVAWRTFKPSGHFFEA
jgi:hypothetical protein